MALLAGPLRPRRAPRLAPAPGLTPEEAAELRLLLARGDFAAAGAGEEADYWVLPAGASAGGAEAGRAPSLPALPPPAAGGPLPSAREREILEYLVDGWSNAEIASVLGIGPRTVRFHLENLYAKLGVARRGEAAREALRLGLVRFEA